MQTQSISQIDDMDFFWYLDLITYSVVKPKELTPIDQIF